MVGKRGFPRKPRKPLWIRHCYARDIAFKLLHCVLPTRNRLARWHLAPSGACTVCGVPDETLLHVFAQCPYTHNVLHLVSSLFRSLSPKIPPGFSLLEAVFCRNVFRSPPLAALLWIVLERHIGARLSRSHQCRRHLQPDYEYFSSQWMPPGVPFPLVSINTDHTSLVFNF